jgi:PTH1 family peptidyl-tRNA hydrolase
LRFGIGHPGHRDLVSNYVLHDFSREEFTIVEPLCKTIADHFDLLLGGKDSDFLSKTKITE